MQTFFPAVNDLITRLGQKLAVFRRLHINHPQDREQKKRRQEDQTMLRHQICRILAEGVYHHKSKREAQQQVVPNSIYSDGSESTEN
jgi:hypothetical protein